MPAGRLNVDTTVSIAWNAGPQTATAAILRSTAELLRAVTRQPVGSACVPAGMSRSGVLAAPNTGAELPTSVSVALTADRGQAVWYLAQRESTLIDTRPGIARETAIATAAGLLENAPRWDARQPSSTRLQVIHDEDNRQRLVWAVSYPRSDEAEPFERSTIRLLIDAENGQPLERP